MKSRKTIKHILGLLSVLLVIWLGWTLLTNPFSTRKEVEKIGTIESEVSDRYNYDQLVQIDKKQGNDFLTSKVKYAKVVNEAFPFSSRRFDEKQASLILEVLSDTSSYRWGEFGTPTYDQTVFYYDSTDQVIGYTIIDMMGEIENYPYRSLMKWGMMTDKGFGRLVKLMNRK
tara:strand:- start:1511 stop:2026 length:516 start_codon:yes stop_codon:yes gene_type:complete